MEPKPDTIGVRLDKIPEAIRVLDRWILWSLEWKRRGDGSEKWTKIPKQPSGRWAAVNSPETWCSFDEATQAMESGKFSGLGLVLPPGIVGVDLDDCYSGEGFSEQAKMILAMMPTYAEISPSGSGVKLLAAGALSAEMRKISHGRGVELYDGASTGRFFCITGHALEKERHHQITSQRDSLHAVQAMISEPKKLQEKYDRDPAKISKAIEYLEHLDESRCEEYSDWLSVGMALHWCDPSEEMFRHWCRWSQQSAKFDEDDALQTWESFRREEGERVITIGWLERAAKDDGFDPDRFRTGMQSGTSLLAKKITRDFLVEDFMVRGEPMIIGGAAKALKTTVALELAVSIATGTPFLGTYNVPKRERVLFISGESGESTLQENLRLIAESKGLSGADLADFQISFKLPKLDDATIVEDLIEELRESEVDIVFVDPLYRSLRVGDSASNVYSMGEQLELIAEQIHRAGITVVLLHHFKKQGKSFADPPELEDLSQSGVAEFGRQFLLIKRREAYQMDGNHTLWFHWGGSAGHQGMKMLEACTGTRATGLTWATTLRSPQEWKAVREELQAAEKDQESEDLKDRVYAFIGQHQGCTKAEVEQGIAGRGKQIRDVIAALINEDEVVVKKGAHNKHLLFQIVPDELDELDEL
ncbi:hypothetical protein Mal15_22200 [Stieleria maiorica]|uniref:Primase C-terminal 2 domain-containing protein n=2 Tax=Stieleria maiorica TaxID=2795974 RepID=A0A5B9MAB5_9BACT|nr:hypothetical protein Mal15_22200 [Stieleria maiorica]